MSSTVLKALFCAMSIAFFSTTVAYAAPLKSGQQITLVASLYKKFAWETFANSGGVFGKSLAQEDRATLMRYFDPTLSSLIMEDRSCVEKSGEICNLDFDPIFASQDPGATDLTIHSKTDNIVHVDFTYPANRERIRLEYHLVLIGGVWKISDIRYLTSPETSLKKKLSRKVRPQN